MSTHTPLYHVAAQGHFITRLGKQSWSLDEAVEMSRDLRSRGYADAHAQRCLRDFVESRKARS